MVIVEDRLTGRGTHRFEINFQLALDLKDKLGREPAVGDPHSGFRTSRTGNHFSRSRKCARRARGVADQHDIMGGATPSARLPIRRSVKR